MKQKLNRKAFARLARRLQLIPDEQFKMNSYGCGSVGCIAFHANALGRNPGTFSTYAAALALGLDFEQKADLFTPLDWEGPRHPYDRLLAAELCARIAKGMDIPNYDWLRRARAYMDKTEPRHD